jgi:hypothetical protein
MAQTQNIEDDLYLLFNLAFEGLDKTNLTEAAKEANLEEISGYLSEPAEKTQVAVINTRNQMYPRALLIRKMVDGKAVVFAFWRRGSVCEGMAVSLEGASPLNEFIWIQEAGTGKFKATLRPKIDVNQRKERQVLITRAAISTVVVDSLNRAEYKSKFGGNILQKLKTERGKLMENMKKSGLIPKNAADPLMRGIMSAAKGDKIGNLNIGKDGKIGLAPTTLERSADDKRSEFIATQQKGGGISAAVTHSYHSDHSESMADKLMKELEREALLADRKEEQE